MVSGGATPATSAAPATFAPSGATSDQPGERRRVVITGLGAITAAGPTMADCWSALCEGRVCTSPLTAFEASRPAAAGQVSDDWRGIPGAPDWLMARLDRASHLALDAAIQAQSDARIEFSQQNAYVVGAVSGIAHPGAGSDWSALGSGLAGASLGLDIAGPVFNVSAGAASGLAALSVATQLIRSGAIRAAIAIGAEAPLRSEVWQAYETAGLLAAGASLGGQRPYDVQRSGMILGEGAAALMLEDRQLAVQRGVHIYAEVAGEAMTAGPMADGQAPTDVEVARRAIGEAMRAGEVSPSEIDAVVVAGGGSRAGDERETDVIERAFGRRTLDMYAATATPNLGATIGASGAIAAAIAALIVDRCQIPPHATLSEPDLACGLGFTNRRYDDQVVGALASAYGAHGQNAAVILMPHRAEAGDELPILVN